MEEGKGASEFVCTWANALFTSLTNVEETTAKKILRRSAEICAGNWLVDAGFGGKTYDVDLAVKALDEYLKKHEMGNVKKEDNSVYVEYRAAQCPFPLVTQKVVELAPRLCTTCGTNFYEVVFERTTGVPVRAELLNSFGLGGDRCILRLHLP